MMDQLPETEPHEISRHRSQHPASLGLETPIAGDRTGVSPRFASVRRKQDHGACGQHQATKRGRNSTPGRPGVRVIYASCGRGSHKIGCFVCQSGRPECLRYCSRGWSGLHYVTGVDGGMDGWMDRSQPSLGGCQYHKPTPHHHTLFWPFPIRGAHKGRVIYGGHLTTSRHVKEGAWPLYAAAAAVW